MFLCEIVVLIVFFIDVILQVSVLDSYLSIENG